MKYVVKNNYNKKCRVKLFDFVSAKLTIYAFLLLSFWLNQAAAIINIHLDKPHLFLNEECNPTVRVNVIDEKQSGSESHLVFLLQEKYKFILPESLQWTQLDQITGNTTSVGSIKSRVSVNSETTINLTNDKCCSNYLLELIHMMTLADDISSICQNFISSSSSNKKSQINKGVTLLKVEDGDKSAKTEDKIFYFCEMLEAMKYLGFHNIDFMSDIVNSLDKNYVNLTNRKSHLSDQQLIGFPIEHFGDKDIHKFFSVVKDVTYFLFTEYCIPETHEKLMGIFTDPLTMNIIRHSVYFVDSIITWSERERDNLDIVNKYDSLGEDVKKNNKEIDSLKNKIYMLGKCKYEDKDKKILELCNKEIMGININIHECQKTQRMLEPVIKAFRRECNGNESELDLLFDYSTMHLTLQLRWEQIMMSESTVSVESTMFPIPDKFKTIFPFVGEVRLMVEQKMTSNNFFDKDYIAPDTSILINIANDWDCFVPNIDPLECNYTTDMIIGLRQLTLLMALKSCGASLHFSSHAFDLSDYLKSENKCELSAREMICPMLTSINILYGDCTASNEYKFLHARGKYTNLYTVPLALPNEYGFYVFPAEFGNRWYNETKYEDGSTDVTLMDISCNVIKSYMKLVKNIFRIDCFRDKFIPLIYDKHSNWINKMSGASK